MDKEKKKEYNKKYYKVVREDSEKVKRYYKDNVEKAKLWKLAYPDKAIYSIARYRAKKKGIPFDITLEDITIPTHCPYLGMEITYTRGQGAVSSNPSLDRIDSSKGYTKGNVQVISTKANTMKNNATEEQLITFAKNVLKLHPRT